MAIVTGASRGIGRAISLDLGRQGAAVIGTSTTTEGVGAIEAAFELAGVNGEGVVLDVSDPSSVRAFFAGLDGSASLLVNNAGITRDNLITRISEEDWSVVLETNLGSVYRMCRACARQMIKNRGGRIINITSVTGATGSPGQTHYAAAKAGVVGFTRSLARELAPRNITVNAVAPGFIDTDMTRALSDAQREKITGQIPLGRMGEAVDVAVAVRFLASPGAAYITGQTLHVNGGMYMA